MLPDLDPALLLEAGGPALVALPLVGPEERVRANARGWLQAVRAQATDEQTRQHATDLFTRFLAWRLDTMDVKDLLATGEEDVMKETATGRALLAEGRAEGEARGETRGRRRMILLVLETRLGAVPSWVSERLEKEHDLGRLEQLMKAAMHVESEADLGGLFGA